MPHRHRGVHLMHTPGQARQHGCGILTIGRLAEDGAIQFDHGIRTQHRKAQQVAQIHARQRRPPFQTPCVVQNRARLAGAGHLDDVHAARHGTQRQHVEGDADLLQQSRRRGDCEAR